MIRYFPFSPGIPWNLRNDFIIPKVPSNIWYKKIEGKDVVIVCRGGLIESFISLIYCETINYLFPNNKQYWYGNSIYNDLITINGLSKVLQEKLPDNIEDKYPVPIFLDRNDTVYFNCLNNYLIEKSFDANKIKHSKKTILEKIYNNICLSEIVKTLPQLRVINDTTQSWAKYNKFSFSHPYVCIFPDKQFSLHSQSFLGWNVNQIKSLGAILQQSGIQTIVFTNSPQKFHGGQVFCLPIEWNNVFKLMPEAKAVLSEDIDFLLISGLIGKAKIITRPTVKQLSLENNFDFFNQKPAIYSDEELTPQKAFEKIKES